MTIANNIITFTIIYYSGGGGIEIIEDIIEITEDIKS